MDVLARLRDLLQVTGGGFPAPQPVALTRSSMTILQKGNREYMVAEKTDGVRVLLFFSRDPIGNKPQLFVVERKLTLRREFGLQFPDQLFDGTVLDAEQVGSTYVVFDCYALGGLSCAKRNLRVRLEYASVAIKCLSKQEQARFRLKPMFPFSELRTFCTVYMQRAQRDFACDGVIFTPVEDPLVCGTHGALLKAKPLEHCTCDLLVRPVTGESKRAWDRSFCSIDQRIIAAESVGERERPDGVLAELWFLVDEMELLSVIRWPSDLISLPSCLRGESQSEIWECKPCLQGNTWIPLKPRLDKKVPNHRNTVLDTVRCLHDDLQLAELFST